MRSTFFAMVAVAALSFPVPSSAQDHGGHEPSGEHVEHGGEHAEHGHHDAALNWFDLGGGFFNFAILVALFYFGLRKPLAEFLTTRKANVQEALAEAQRLKEAAEAKYAEYQKRLEGLDAELAGLRKEIVAAGEADRQRIIEEAEKKAARLRKDAQFLIDQQLKQLKIDLTKEAVEAAVKAAEEVLKKQTSAADQTRLADEYLKTLTAELGARAKVGGAR